MGNSLACVSSIQAHTTWLDHFYFGYTTVRVVHLVTGEIYEYCSPMMVAELMLEHPHHFVSQSGSLHVGDRPLALSADEELIPAQLYALLPMRKLHSRISAEDVYVLSNVDYKKGKTSKLHDCKITPLQTDALQFDTDSENEREADQKAELATLEAKKLPLKVYDAIQLAELSNRPYSTVKCKCWRPNLPSISESSLLNVS